MTGKVRENDHDWRVATLAVTLATKTCIDSRNIASKIFK